MPSNGPILLPPSSYYTVESVLKGHPDKVCDQICDALLDAYLIEDQHARVAVECMGVGSTIVVAGEVSSYAEIDVERVTKSVYREIGYAEDVSVLNLIGPQSEQLAGAVSRGAAGDQGVMYGYACSSSHNSLPFGVYMVNAVAREIDALRERAEICLPDGKVQITVNGNSVESLVINVQHQADADLGWLRETILNDAVSNVAAVNEIKHVFFNNASEFVRGGFANDTGLSGRKMMVDAYGALAPHGGGAFSGKDPSKVDRSGAYMARFVAKSIVGSGLASSCLVSLAYVFGEPTPVMIEVNLDDISARERMVTMIRQKFDFRPDAIAERLGLRSAIYRPTATYGHFTDPGYPWEHLTPL